MSVTPWWSGFEATGFEASRATVMRPDIGTYRILHFATHGLLNDEHPELSGVVLSLFDEKGQRQEGFLRLHDIYNLKLPVDLVVLSACNTGLGKDVRGEGLIGLTRGFMYAGASSVVASLWKVDDDATAELMRYFYVFMLKDGLSPAAALRKAQVSMSQQKRWQSPYYWSGFIIQGQYIQTESAKGWRITSLTLWAGVSALFIVAAFFVLKRRRRTIL
jgi:CHAT domain-containing protein